VLTVPGAGGAAGGRAGGVGGRGSVRSDALQVEDVATALHDAEALGIGIEAIPWTDVRRGWQLCQGSLRFADALYIAAAERHETALLTADTRIERSGAAVHCTIITITGEPPPPVPEPGSTPRPGHGHPDTG
jgi:hypothetical protein